MSRFDKIGKALILLREKADLSQKELARMAGITPGMLSNYENGVTMPSLDSLGKLLDALGVDLARFEVALDVVNDRSLRRDSLDPLASEREAVLGGGDLGRFLDTEGEISDDVRPAVVEMIHGLRSVARRVYRSLLEMRRGGSGS